MQEANEMRDWLINEFAESYMEDELRHLVEQTMLVCNRNKYETAFPILSSQTQEKTWAYNDRMIPQLTGLFAKLIDGFTQACEAHGISYFGNIAFQENNVSVNNTAESDHLVSRGGILSYNTQPPAVVSKCALDLIILTCLWL